MGTGRALSRFLAIYLNDHLAGSHGRPQLGAGALKENRDNEYGRFLATLADEVASTHPAARSSR